MSDINILFLCTGNSCRSVMAEAILRSLAPADMKAFSAGSRPTGFVHPYVFKLLSEKGLDIKGLHSKSWESLTDKPDIVITLCDEAAGEACPLYLGGAVCTHWGMPDPAKASAENAEEVFEFVYANLYEQLSKLVILPLAELLKDKEALTKLLLELKPKRGGVNGGYAR